MAGIDDDARLEREDRAVAAGGEREGVAVFAGVDAGGEILAAVGDPAHRPLEACRAGNGDNASSG
ncbi:MAG: hypothetical protein U0031_11690 [Thermomicrobiales bacterium]